MKESDSLWAKTLVSKYCPNGIMDEKLVTRRNGSNNWKGLKIGHEVFRRGIQWVVNNGHDVSFWHDLWVGDRPLCRHRRKNLSLFIFFFPRYRPPFGECCV